MASLLLIAFALALAVVAFFILLRLAVRFVAGRSSVAKQVKAALQAKRNTSGDGDGGAAAGKAPLVVGFFHPYCNAGGGGERVLWCAVNALHRKYPDMHCVVYTGDIDATPEKILATARDRFGTVIDASRVTFAFLSRREWVEAKYYPHFTMLMQSLGSLVLGWEAMLTFIPDVYLDTMGYAFTYPLFRVLAGCRVGCYVHYPTISTDMLQKVKSRAADFNNKSYVSDSATLSSFKLLYYRMFAAVYGWVGSMSQATVVNSTWTCNHINSIWRGMARKAEVVYPPCDTASLSLLPLAGRRMEIVSVAQFRPEKNHLLQLQAFGRLLAEHPEHKGTARLCLVGGCRNAGDQERVDALKKAAGELGLEMGKDVEFLLNVPYNVLKEHLGGAMVGIHTMRDEHFGIGVVEFLASGCVAVAHNSAGPLFDIVVPYRGSRTGYLAETEEEYAAAIHTILSMKADERLKMQTAARESVQNRFSEAAFDSEFVKYMAPLFA